MYDVLIIGGGVTGAAIARELSRFELAVALVEREPDLAMGATKANSAIVHGGYAEPHTKLKGRLCYQGRKQFVALDRDLGFGFAPVGSMVLAFSEEDRPALVAMMENGERNGLDDLSLLDSEQVRAMEPNVNPDVKYALYCKGAGVCSPFELTYALAENAVANGAHIYTEEEVVAVQQMPGGFFADTRAGTRFQTRYIVNAAGLYAADVSAMAGDGGYSIHPRSGEYIVMAQGSGGLVNSVLFQMPTKMGKGILVAPSIYGNLLIGPDAIDEVLQDRDTHPERLRHILRQAMLTTDRLDIRKYLRSFAGVRPVANTDDFVIGTGRVPGWINAAGIQSPGLTSSPAVAQLVRDTLADIGVYLREKRSFDPKRRPFLRPEAVPAVDVARRIALDEGNPDRLICRCEQVPEPAVRDAFSRGLPVATVDAIKRRTRAGMGLCQGQFCRPRTAKLLTKLNGYEVTAQTDAERDGLHRVTRMQMLDYLKENPL